MKNHLIYLCNKKKNQKLCNSIKSIPFHYVVNLDSTRHQFYNSKNKILHGSGVLSFTTAGKLNGDIHSVDSPFQLDPRNPITRVHKNGMFIPSSEKNTNPYDLGDLYRRFYTKNTELVQKMDSAQLEALNSISGSKDMTKIKFYHVETCEIVHLDHNKLEEEFINLGNNNDGEESSDDDF